MIPAQSSQSDSLPLPGEGPSSTGGTSSAPSPAGAASSTPAPSAPATASPQKGTVSYDTFAQLDLRVALVLEAREHPNANKLLLLKIRVGDVEKQIVAGIRAHYPAESLVGKSIVIVNNLEPALIRGEESNGMLLAASSGAEVVLLQPERPISDGARIK